MFTKKTEEKPLNRYEKLCKHIQERCNGLMEEIFTAVESGDINTAIAKVEQGQKLNQIYMYSMKRGLEAEQKEMLAKSESKV
jgi:hypothetical protein